jgi:hypothetical protein
MWELITMNKVWLKVLTRRKEWMWDVCETASWMSWHINDNERVATKFQHCIIHPIHRRRCAYLRPFGEPNIDSKLRRISNIWSRKKPSRTSINEVRVRTVEASVYERSLAQFSCDVLFKWCRLKYCLNLEFSSAFKKSFQESKDSRQMFVLHVFRTGRP